MKVYSQNSEQNFILDYFKNNPTGKFVEIGGYHPFTFSNTRALYEKGWNGVYVEPSPNCIISFMSEYKNEPRIELVEAAITDYDGKITLYESGGDAISSTDTAHVDKWTRGWNVKYTPIEVNCISMDTFLNKHGKDVDFFNLDVESTNLKLFNLVPDWFWQSIKMVCVEHDGHQEEMKKKLETFGFKEIHFNGENLIMAK